MATKKKSSSAASKGDDRQKALDAATVSYTHLTLPTILRV